MQFQNVIDHNSKFNAFQNLNLECIHYWHLVQLYQRHINHFFKFINIYDHTDLQPPTQYRAL